jgi:hypothetical protein
MARMAPTRHRRQRHRRSLHPLLRQHPRSIVAKKLGIGPEFEPTAAMQAGHDWEARIAQAVEALTGFTVAGEQTWLANTEHPWMRATVDGFLLGHPDDELADAVGLLEIKTTERANWAYYAAQVQWQMLVAGMDRCVVVILDLSDEAQTHDVGDDLVAVERVGRLSLWEHRADRQLQARLYEFGRELWAHVQAGTLPEIEADDYDAVKAENPDATDPNAVDLSHLDDVATGYVRTKAALKAALAEEKRLAAILTDAIGAHETADVHGVTWFTRKANTKGARSLLTTKEAKASC